MPLGLTTRVAGGQGDLTAALTARAPVPHEPGRRRPPRRPEPATSGDSRSRPPHAGARPSTASVEGRSSAPTTSPSRQPAEEPAVRAGHGRCRRVRPPARCASSASRRPASSSRRPRPAGRPSPATRGARARRPGSRQTWSRTRSCAGERVAPIAREAARSRAAADRRLRRRAWPSDPVIGPELAAARSRLGLTVDQLADRTRIRPHVIESIEVDDFTPCGGDFYARGHLRTLARVLGLDVGAAARDVRRALRRRADQPAPGLRGRARDRRARADPRAPAAARTGRCWSPR